MTRKRIQPSKAQMIVNRWFDGKSRDRIAKSVRVSGSTVSAYVGEFVEKAKETSLTDCAAEYDVEEVINNLRGLSVELDKTRGSVKEALDGARLRARCSKLGVSMERLEEFVRMGEKLTHPRYDSKKIIDAVSRLFKLEEETKRPFEEIVTNLERAQTELNNAISTKQTLQKNINGLKTEAGEAKVERDNALKERDMTVQKLNEFEDMRRKLLKRGIDLNDVKKLNIMLGNAKEAGYDAKKIVESIKNIESLTIRRNNLIQDIGTNQKTLDGLQKKITEKTGLLTEADELEKLDLNTERLRTLREKIVEVAARHGFKPKEAVEKFFKDLAAQYDPKLGFELEKDRLETTIEINRLEAEKWKANFGTLQTKYSHMKEAVGATEEIIKGGVKPPQIIAWQKILHKVDKSPETLSKEIEKYGSIEQLNEDRLKEFNRLETKISEAKTQLQTLQEQKAEIEASIKTLTDAGVEKIQNIKDSATKSLETIKSTAEGASKSFLKTLNDNIKNGLNKTWENADKTLTEFDTKREGVFTEIDSMQQKLKQSLISIASECLDAGEKLGRFMALQPLVRLLEKHEGEPHEVLPAVYTTCDCFESWLKKNPPHPGTFLESNLSSFKENLREEMSYG